MERIAFPGRPASPRERAIVSEQIGRDPRGDVAISALCPYGLPAVVRTRPRLQTGEPFPTLFYLVCPVAVREVGRLEAHGMMRECETKLEEDPELRAEYAEAHERYRALRDALEPIDDPMTAGGMPSRVKCLHALYAHELADANPIGALVRDELEPIDCPGDCVVEQPDGTLGRVPGHPGFAGKKRRR